MYLKGSQCLICTSSDVNLPPGSSRLLFPLLVNSLPIRPFIAPLLQCLPSLSLYLFRVPSQHLPARAGGGGGHQQQQRVRIRLPRQRPQFQPVHLQAQRQVLQRAGRQGAALAFPQVDDDAGQNVGSGRAVAQVVLRAKFYFVLFEFLFRSLS